MNLKRLHGIATVALITIAAALFAGCSNSMAGSVDGDYQMATLSLSATGIPNDYAEQFEKSYPTAAKAAARSITPDKPYTPADTTLTFFLSGTSETGKKLDDTEVKVSLKSGTGATAVYQYKAADGTTDVSLLSMSWNLVLTAYTDGATRARPVLQGFCSVDLRTGSGTANFTLSPENLTTPGSVNIMGSFKPYGNVDSYTMGIYKKDSASEMKHEMQITSLVGDGEKDENFTYTCNSIEPGNYLYKMVFKNSDGVITGSFIDTLIVDAGNALSRDLDLIDVVNKKPGKPTDFTASLENKSESTDGTYRVKLNWKSGSGETNFEVELTEYAADGTGTDTGIQTIYGMASMDPKDDDGNPIDKVENFQGSDVWAGKGGAMTYGDAEAFFKLKLGVVYEVRIRARNYVGTSDWETRGVLADADADAGFTPYGSEKINRMKIEYNLNGGKLSLYNNNNRKEYSVNYTEYRSWNGVTTPEGVLLVIGTNDADNQLTKGTSPFSKWVDSAGATPGVLYQNLSVTADFGSSVTGDIDMVPEKKDISLNDITLSYQAGENAATSELASDRTSNTVSKTTNGQPTQLTIALDTDGTGYTNIKFELTYAGDSIFLPYGDAAKNSCKLSLDNYAAGKLLVRVIADTANAKNMSQTLIFDLQ